MNLNPLIAALHSASEGAVRQALIDVLREMPDDLFHAEVGRRRSLKRTPDQQRGPTGNWSKHNPEVNNCRCDRCHLRRERSRR